MSSRYPAPFKVGDKVSSNRYGDAVVIEYINSKNITVQFEDGRFGSHLQADAIKKGHFTPDNTLRTKSIEVWLEKSVKAHGEGRYDYSKVVFGKSDSVVEIGCNKCGLWFRSTLSDHHNKYCTGCPRCAREEAEDRARLPVEEFIDRAGRAHNWKYMYDLKSYRGSTHPVKIICPIHGEYTRNAGDHMQGRADCPVCRKINSDNNRLTGSPERKGYKYLFVEGGQVWLTHEDCGTTFRRTLQSIEGTNKFLCPKCGIQNVTIDVFKERAEKIHGDSYEYSDWVSIHSLLTFKHKSCGNTFVANAGSHISGNYGKGVGCPYCATYGFSLGRPAHLYILKAPNGYVKVGITHQGVTGRLRQISKSTKKIGWEFYEVTSWEMSGLDAKKVEELAHEELRKKYKSPTEKFDGSGETFVDANIEEAVNFIKNILERSPINGTPSSITN